MIGPWLLLLAFAGAVVGLHRSGRPSRTDLTMGGALVIMAAGLRITMGLWGPLHVNGQGPLWIRGALLPSELDAYGPGYAELFAWVGRLGANADLAVFAGNCAFACAAPVLLFALARAAGLAPGVAFGVGALMAFDPVSVRIGATETYLVPIIALCLASQWLLLLAARALERNDRVAAGLLATAGALVATVAVRVHPAAYLPVALCPLIVLGAPTGRSWTERLGWSVAAAAIVGATVVATSGDVVVHALTLGRSMIQVSTNTITPKMLVLAAVLGVAAWLMRGSRAQSGPAVLGVGSLLAMLATYHVYDQHPLWRASYERLYFGGIALGIAASLPRRALTPIRAAVGASLAALGLLVASWTGLQARTTDELEYDFLRRHLPSAPPGCVLASVSRVGNRIAELPDYLSAAYWQGGRPGLPLRAPEDLSSARASHECIWYVRSSLCTTAAAREKCERIEALAPGELVARARLAARPSYLGFDYDRPEVRVEIRHIRGSRPHPSDGLVPADSVAASERTSCSLAISPAAAHSLYSSLQVESEPDGCRLQDLETHTYRMMARYRALDGSTHAVVIVPNACGSGMGAGPFTVNLPPAFVSACPRTAAAALRAVSRAPPPLAVTLVRGATSTSSGSGAVAPHLALGMAPLGLALLALGISIVEVGRRRWSWEGWRVWLWVGGVTFTAALVARLLVEAGPANWYSEVGEAASVGSTRFGPSAAAFRSLLMLVFPGSDRALFATNAVLGAITVPVCLVLLWAVGIDERAALATGLLLAVSPLHVRVSASGSAHVLSSTLCMLALAISILGVRVRRWLLILAGCMIVPAACFTRADACTQLVAAPVWMVLAWRRDGPHREPDARTRWGAAAAWTVAWCGSALSVWWFVVRASNHPLPETAGMRLAVLRLFAQYPAVALQAPGWVPIGSVTLATVGAAYLLWGRRRLLACLVLTLGTCFALLGRNLERDGLVGARYFLLTIPVYLVAAGYGLVAILELGARAVRRLGAGPKLVGGLLGWPGAAAGAGLFTLGVVTESRSAYAYRYAFQVEYSLLRSWLAELPDNCTVFQLPTRVPEFERDLDCCLDLPRSSLAAAYPRLHLRELPEETITIASFQSAESDGCIAYYEGSTCALYPTSEATQRHAKALAHFRDHCENARHRLTLTALDSGYVPPHATNDVFHDAAHEVRLWSVQR